MTSCSLERELLGRSNKLGRSVNYGHTRGTHGGLIINLVGLMDDQFRVAKRPREGKPKSFRLAYNSLTSVLTNLTIGFINE